MQKPGGRFMPCGQSAAELIKEEQGIASHCTGCFRRCQHPAATLSGPPSSSGVGEVDKDSVGNCVSSVLTYIITAVRLKLDHCSFFSPLFGVIASILLLSPAFCKWKDAWL